VTDGVQPRHGAGEGVVLFVGQLVSEKYRLLQPIGEGGMASVWSARHELLGRDVALKLAPVFGDPVQTNRFLREAQIIGQFEHPNIVNVLDAGEVADQGYLFLAMELLRGKPFSALIAGGRVLEPSEVLPILIGVCKGLEAAHDAGVVHRDVKPENVFLAETTGGMTAKLVDFGISLAKSSGSARITIDGQILGTPAYMSPEQARGKGEVGAAADIWAVGVMLFECLAGRQPFIASNYHALLRQILDDEAAPLPESTSLELQAIVARCLEKNPEDRYPSAAALRADLEALLNECPPASVASRATVPAPALVEAPASREPYLVRTTKSLRLHGARGRILMLAAAACGIAGLGAARGPSTRELRAAHFVLEPAAIATLVTPAAPATRAKIEPIEASTMTAPATALQRKERSGGSFVSTRVTSPGF
jgi:serine/threonine protein kinase